MLPMLIGIAGGTGSGKTTVALKLAAGAARGAGGADPARLVLPRSEPPDPRRARRGQLRRARRAGERAAAGRPAGAEGEPAGRVSAIRLRHPHPRAPSGARSCPGRSSWSRGSCCLPCPPCATSSICACSSTPTTTSGCSAGYAAISTSAGATWSRSSLSTWAPCAACTSCTSRPAAPTPTSSSPKAGENAPALEVIVGRLLYLLDGQDR